MLQVLWINLVSVTDKSHCWLAINSVNPKRLNHSKMPLKSDLLGEHSPAALKLVKLFWEYCTLVQEHWTVTISQSNSSSHDLKVQIASLEVPLQLSWQRVWCCDVCPYRFAYTSDWHDWFTCNKNKILLLWSCLISCCMTCHPLDKDQPKIITFYAVMLFVKCSN